MVVRTIGEVLRDRKAAGGLLRLWVGPEGEWIGEDQDCSLWIWPAAPEGWAKRRPCPTTRIDMMREAHPTMAVGTGWPGVTPELLDERLRLTAHHEAAHFVVRLAVGRGAAYDVSIVPDGDAAGEVRGAEDLPTTPSAEDYEAIIVESFAGHAAAVRAGDDEARAMAAAEYDNEQADDYLRVLSGDRADNEARLRARAAVIVAERWHSISYLAAVLLEFGSLDGGQAKLCIMEADGDPEAAGTLDDVRRWRVLAPECFDARGWRKG